MKNIFNFNLDPIQEVCPWGTKENKSIHWMALTQGQFWMTLGETILFKYSDEMIKKYGNPKYADYYIASFVRDIIEVYKPSLGEVPRTVFEATGIDNCYDFLSLYLKSSVLTEQEDFDDNLHYDAWRWLGERSPCFSYLASTPELVFINDEIGRAHV